MDQRPLIICCYASSINYLHLINATDFPHFLHFNHFISFSFPSLLSTLFLTPSTFVLQHCIYVHSLYCIGIMRSRYLLLSLLAPTNALAGRGRPSDYISTSPLVSKEDAEDTIHSFELSPRERNAVFGDTSKLFLLLPYGHKLKLFSYHKTTKSDRLPFVDRKAAGRTM